MKKLFLALFALFTLPAVAMQAPTGRQNQVQSDRNQQIFQNQPYFTLAVLQPATGYLSLESYVQQVAPQLKAAGYGLVPSNDWHLSVMVFAIPFPGGKVDSKYVHNAMHQLETILTKEVGSATNQVNLDALTDITFGFDGLESIGTHKFMVAKFKRIHKPFFRVYGDIVRSFFDQYPDSWMLYGYGMVPHISVASKMKAAGAATATQISDQPAQPIKELLLRHKGKASQRKLVISGRYFDPQQQKLVELKSNPL